MNFVIHEPSNSFSKVSAHAAVEVALLQLFLIDLMYICLSAALTDWLPKISSQSSPKSLLREMWIFKSYTSLRISGCRFQFEFQTSRILKGILGCLINDKCRTQLQKLKKCPLDSEAFIVVLLRLRSLGLVSLGFLFTSLWS